jgi:expansin (peptidoglycan-binding protein)
MRLIFDNAVRKWLEIPTVINDYNHYINAVDINNQLKAPITLIRGRETRN